MASAEKQVTKVVKKRWFDILAPESFNRVDLGETLVAEQNELLNKYITVTLSTLTRNIKHQNTKLTLKVTSIKENKGLTDIVAYEQTPAAIKRMVKRNINKLDDSFLIKTSDGITLRVKPLILTRGKTKGSVQSKIRETVRDFFNSYMSNTTFLNILNDVMSRRIYKELTPAVNKIYPIRIVTIRKLNVEVPSTKKKVLVAKPKPEPKPEIPEETDLEEKPKKPRRKKADAEADN
ncbi:MAG: hypothetical protein ABIG95_05455 [Candidatus Woesearchaeota archaeon]